MRESIGSTALYNIIITFLSIIFALILGTMVYYQAFKVNKSLVNIIQKYEGYNDLAVAEIDVKLESIGYIKRNLGNCPVKKGQHSLVNEKNVRTSIFPYCVYRFGDTNSKYYHYGVISYVVIDMPLVNSNMFNFAIYSETDQIYNFSS